MGRRKKGAFPQITIHKTRNAARLRFGTRDIWLGPAGSRKAQQNHERVLTAWMANGGKLPEDYRLEKDPADDPMVMPPRQSMPTLQAHPAGSLTVGDLVAAALTELAAGKTKSQLRSVSRWWRCRAAAVALEPYVRMPAHEFGPRALGEVARRLATEPMAHRRGRKRVQRTRTAVREVVEEIRRIFREAVSREELPPERLVALESLRKLPGIEEARDPIERKPVSVETFEATLAHLPPVVADLLRFMLLTGCRPSEACRASRCEIDTATTPWVWQPRKHKTMSKGRPRVIAIGPRARAILERWWGDKDPDNPVFTRGDLKPAAVGGTIPMRALRTAQVGFDYADVRRRIQKACDAAGVDRWTTYQVRHSALTELRAVGGRDAAQLQAGHSNASITERYARPSVAAQAAAVEAIG